MREGCWYCHTQQTRTLVADTKRSGWRGVDSPVSTPDEFVYDNPHLFGTKRTGPDLSRVGGKYDTQWHRTHFRNPRDLVPRLRHAAVPVDRQRPRGVHRAGDLHPDARPRQGLAAGQGLREMSDMDYTWPSISSRISSSPFVGVAVFFFVRSCKDGYWGRIARTSSTGCSRTTDAKQPTDCTRRRRAAMPKTRKTKLKEYAGGWITEREGTEIPAF